jgi:DNA helicase II / ATP-dependent DNA helicase PcrA
LGYRVRTLHGLAHDIVRERPAVVGLETRFSIIDEREATFIRKEAVNAWLNANPFALDDYLDPSMDDNKRDWVRRQQLPDMLDSLALAFIRSSKDRRLTPDSLRLLLGRQPAALPLATMGLTIYSDYQRALTYRGAVDFRRPDPPGARPARNGRGIPRTPALPLPLYPRRRSPGFQFAAGANFKVIGKRS